MKAQRLGHAFGVATVSVLLTGCGGLRPSIAAPGAMSQSRTITAHADHGRSPIFPEAKNSTLLYASDSKNDVVWVYSYPSGKQLGELKGFPAEPAGLCSDPSGDVYVTTQGNGKSASQSYVYEYAHGGTSPIATLSDPGLANGCAVDPNSGNLAVANYLGASGTDGDIAVYQDAEGSPTTYSDPNFTRFLWCTYDDSGNLFADEPGQIVDELPKGGNALVELELSADINSGSIQWVSNQLVIAKVVGIHGSNPIYQVTVSGSVGSVYGPILLSSTGDKSAAGDIQFWVQKNTIIGPGHRQGINGLLQFWNYPQGGLPTKVIRPSNDRSFFGITVSLAAP